MRILWLKTELLHPVDRGGRIRTYSMLRAIARRHHVTYAALDDGRSAPDALRLASEYAAEVVTFPFASPPRRSGRFLFNVLRNAATPLPFSAWRFRSQAMLQYVSAAANRRAFDVIVADFLFPTVNLPSSPALPVVLFQHNVESIIWQRLAATSTGPARAYYAMQYRRMLRYEGYQCRKADLVVAVSEEDATTIRRQYGVERVGVVPTGVDTDYFVPGASATGRNVVFLGAMDWLPNEDAAAFLLDQILPLLRQQVPDATLTIVGRNPSDSLRRRASAEQGVTLTGTVPDVRPYLASAAAFVVPLRVGGGTRLKIFEGMAMGLPVVSTTIGAEGLPVRHGQDILIADDAPGLASSLAGVLLDRAAAGRLGADAAALVRREFSWDSAATRFLALCDSVVDRGPSPIAGRVQTLN